MSRTRRSGRRRGCPGHSCAWCNRGRTIATRRNDAKSADELRPVSACCDALRCFCQSPPTRRVMSTGQFYSYRETDGTGRWRMFELFYLDSE